MARQAERRTADPSPPDSQWGRKTLDRIRAKSPLFAEMAARAAKGLTPEPPEPAPLPPDPATMTKAQRKAFEKRQRKEAAAERQRQAAEEERRSAEVVAEALAPRVQREPVTAADGTVLRGARVHRSGATFERSSPLVHLMRRAGESPVITKAHLRAAAWLKNQWELAGDGIGVGASNYGERTGGGFSDLPSDAGFIWSQIEAQRNIAACQTFLGALWSAIMSVVILGMDVTSYAATRKLRREVALGYVAAALDRLVEFRKPPPAPPLVVEIRSALVVTPAVVTQAVDSDAAS